MRSRVLFSRILFSAGGFAAGLIVGLAIASLSRSPSAETARALGAAEHAADLLEASERRNAELLTAAEKSSAGLERLLDERADLEQEVSNLETLAEEYMPWKVRGTLAEEETERLGMQAENLKTRLAAEEDRSRQSQDFSAKLLARNKALSSQLDRANERLRDAGLDPVE